MGFSLTGSHVIFFIAAVIVAGTVSGIFIGVTMNITSSFSERGDRVQEQLDTDFQIINDPDNIPIGAGCNGNDCYIFYIKNIGGCTLITTNQTFQVFVDGEIIEGSSYCFENTSIRSAEVTELYVLDSEIAAGDHTMRLVGPMAIEDEFEFTI